MTLQQAKAAALKEESEPVAKKVKVATEGSFFHLTLFVTSQATDFDRILFPNLEIEANILLCLFTGEDEGLTQVKDWRHKLQKVFLGKTPPVAEVSSPSLLLSRYSLL